MLTYIYKLILKPLREQLALFLSLQRIRTRSFKVSTSSELKETGLKNIFVTKFDEIFKNLEKRSMSSS